MTDAATATPETAPETTTPKRPSRRTLIRCAVGLALLIAFAAWIAWGNTALEVNTYTVRSDKLPAAFDGFRIAQVSDLHNTEMGEDNEKLLAALREASPDIIVLTGDLIDSRNTDVEIALEFARRATDIAPCYYVMGNHEARTNAYSILKKGLHEAGVTVLEDARAELERQGDTITLIGVNDPSRSAGNEADTMRRTLERLTQPDTTGGYTVLLSHRPELMDVYAACGVDLVFSGHAHGGQFRLPLIGGLAAPNQGLFPRYDGGVYTQGGTRMAVSRGVGNSIIPVRIGNRPEVVVVELATA